MSHDRVVQLSLLDRFELRCGREAVDLPLSVQRVVAFVALRERPAPRALVAGVLWPDTTDRCADASLRTALWRLRRANCPILDPAGQHLGVAPEASVDVVEATSRARRLLNGTPACLEGDMDDLARSSELLPGWYDEWVVSERERLRQLRLYAAEEACRRLILVARLGEAIDIGLRVVAQEPLRESARRALIAAHIAGGNVAEARRQYETFRRLLWDDLGTEPSADLESLAGLGQAGRRPSPSAVGNGVAPRAANGRH